MPSRSDGVPAIVARHVSKRFLIRHNSAQALKDRVLGLLDPRKRERVETFWALRDVSLTVQPGEAVGLVGRNGSGKSTFLKLVAGLMTPTSGDLFLRAGTRVGTMIELGVGFHPELTALENVYLSASIHGLEREEIDRLVPAITEYSGLANFMDQPLRSFSSGMYMRLGFAVAANLKPDLLLLDEVFAVGDADFQQRCIRTMRDIRERGCTVLFVSHAMAAVREVCSRVVVLDAGEAVFTGDVDEGLAEHVRLMALEAATALPGAESRLAPDDDPTTRAHRVAMGAGWDALGPWAADFLRRQGLQTDQFFLDLGCGSLPVALHVLPLMAPARYWGVDADHGLFDAGVRLELWRAGVIPERGHFLINADYDMSACPQAFHMGLVHSLAHRLPADRFAHVIASAVGRLVPGGRLFVAVPAGHTAHLQAIERMTATLGVPLNPVDDAAAPNGVQVLCITRVLAA